MGDLQVPFTLTRTRPPLLLITLDASGRCSTLGDRGYIGEDGCMYLTGRSAECVVSGGLNLYPARVDEALISHPDVRDGAAFELGDTELGEVMAAAVIPAAGASSDGLIESIITYCRETIGSQLAPRQVLIVDELPRTETVRLYRHRVAEQFSA